MEEGVVTISPKFQVLIPRVMRKDLKLKPGQKMVVVEKGDQLVFVPLKAIGELKGTLKKMDLSDLRNHSERF